MTNIRPINGKPDRLPAETTSFVGRHHELGVVKQRLAASRVVTLVGPGGVGKSRLALRAAKDLRRRFRGRVWWVEMADLRDGALVPNLVAERLGVHDQSTRSQRQALIEHLPVEPALLVLDNCEHLAEACAELVTALLQARSQLRVLLTSRQSVGLLGEHVCVVPPLPLPAEDEPDQGRGNPSVRLFVERTEAVRPGFTGVDGDRADIARICRALEGIPLAIELAAVRVRGLSVEQIAQRLSDRYHLLNVEPRGVPERQRSLRALMDWSWELCPPQEQLAWARMAVFSGSFDLEAAEHVLVGDGLHHDEVLGVVGALVDKSLLAREEHDGRVRYRLLETIREYGADKLAFSGKTTETRRRHRDWYVKLVDQFASDWHSGPDQVAWLHRLRSEHANLRLALAFCATDPGQASAGLRIAAQLEDYWGVRGLHTEARHWLDQLLLSASPGHEVATALRMGGWFALVQGDREIGERMIGEAADLAQELGDEPEIAYVLHARGMAALFDGDLDGATDCFTAALKLFKEAHVRNGVLFSLFSLGLTLGTRHRGDGLAVLGECVRASRETGDIFWRSYALWAIAHIEYLHGFLAHAAEADKQALRLQRLLDDRLALALALDTLAWVSEAQGQHTRAATIFGTAAALWQALGTSPAANTTFAACHDDALEHTGQALGSRAFTGAFEHGQQMGLERAIDYALDIQHQAGTTEPTQPKPLTQRQRQVAELIAEGLTNEAIGARLFIAQRTVETHVNNILIKLGLHSRAQIAARITAHTH